NTVGEKIRLEWREQDLLLDVWVIAKIGAFEAGRQKIKIIPQIKPSLIKIEPEVNEITVDNPIRVAVYSTEKLSSVNLDVQITYFDQNAQIANKTLAPLNCAFINQVNEVALNDVKSAPEFREVLVNLPNPNAGKEIISAKRTDFKPSFEFEIYGAEDPMIPTINNYQFRVERRNLRDKLNHEVPDMTVRLDGSVLDKLLQTKDYNFIIVAYDAFSRRSQISDVRKVNKFRQYEFVIKSVIQVGNMAAIEWEPEIALNFGHYIIEYSYTINNQTYLASTSRITNRLVSTFELPIYPAAQYRFKVKSYDTAGNLLKETQEFLFTSASRQLTITDATYLMFDDKVRLTWSQPVAPNLGIYRVEYTKGSDPIQTLLVSNVNFAEIPVYPGKTYNFNVKLLFSNSELLVSSVYNYAVPYNFKIWTIISPEEDGIWVEWTEHPNAAYYKVKWNLSDGSGSLAPAYVVQYIHSGEKILYPPYNNSYFIEKLEPSRQYSVVVEAYSSNGVKLAATESKNQTVSTTSTLQKITNFEILEARPGNTDGSLFVRWQTIHQNDSRIVNYIVHIGEEDMPDTQRREFSVRLGLVDRYEFTGIPAGMKFDIGVVAVSEDMTMLFETQEQIAYSKLTS
ncbi:MAG TPA: fibronectin type III domain-containing protein, partial [bacterium]|nr:fibronectin type III domain-containing protein [bacterium]